MRFILGVILYVSMYINNIFFHGTDKKMIIGVWQFGCVEVNTGYFDTYQFFENGTFKFNTNQNDETRRIISIGGTYTLNKNYLVLHTTFINEIQGGYLVRSETAGGSGWGISGGKPITTQFQSPKADSITVDFCENEKGYILLDSRKYYLIEEDPNNFH